MKKGTRTSNEIFTDFKAVAQAADLIERNIVDSEQIEVIPLGAEKRGFAKDIEETYSYYSERRRQHRIRISTNREGLYDMLPEGLFHRPPRGSSALDEEGMIEDIRERREEEKQARLFFIPFDAELNHARVLTELYENKLDKKTSYTHLSQIFQYGWDEFAFLDKEQSIIWMHLLPEIQGKRNDIAFISMILTALFNVPIEITDTSATIKPMPIAEELQMELGRSALGINTIIGHNFISDQQRLSVNIGPTSPNKLVDFMPGHKNRTIVDMAIGYLIPVDTEVHIELLTAPDFQNSFLHEDSESNYLGYTVFL